MGGDLKKVPTWLTEVDRVEVLPIQDRGHVHSLGGEGLPPALLLSIGCYPPGHMVDTPSCNYPAQEIRPAAHIDQRSRSPGSDFIAEDALFFGQLAETKCFGQELRGMLVAFFPNRHTVDATNDMFGRDGASCPAGTFLCSGIRNKFDCHPIRVTQRDHLFSQVCARPLVFHTT